MDMSNTFLRLASGSALRLAPDPRAAVPADPPGQPGKKMGELIRLAHSPGASEGKQSKTLTQFLYAAMSISDGVRTIFSGGSSSVKATHSEPW